MKVSVNVQLNYYYEVDVNDTFEDNDLIYCESMDPVYRDICKILHKNHLNFSSETVSIVDEEGEVLI